MRKLTLKLIIILILFIAAFTVFVICYDNWYEKKYFSYFPYPVTDEEYLMVNDLDELPRDTLEYEIVCRYLEDFSVMLINESYYCNGTLNERLCRYITEENFSKLNVAGGYETDQTVFKAIQVSCTKVNYNNEKAIVDIHCYSSYRIIDDYTYNGHISGGEHEIKIYYSKINDIWTVENVVDPP